MPTLRELTEYCDARTARAGIVDFPGAVNGLQVENDGNVAKIGAAVDAGLRVFEEAARRGIDFLIVHHGLFWQPQQPMTGTVFRKFKTCFDANLAVYGCHLPLDAHREIGNNAVLARELGLSVLSWELEFNGTAFAAVCRGIPRAELAARLRRLFPETFRAIECGSENPERIAILSGSGNAAVPALASLGCDTLVTGEIIRAVTILVVFCPCSLVLATPTAIVAAIGNLTRHGILVREGDALERLADVKLCAVDKTGSLTCGTPQVTAVRPLRQDMSEQELHRLTAAAEQRSEHPLGRAVLEGFRNRSSLPSVESFRMVPGRGVHAVVESRDVLAGSAAFLAGEGIILDDDVSVQVSPYLEQGCTIIFVAVDGRPAGFLALSDVPRPDAADTVRSLKAAGITPVLLTGDHANAARHIASTLGIETFRAECLPEDKLRFMDECRDNVCMIGDGINDAPALKKAHVGMAMGGMGSDIAVDAADLVLVRDGIGEVPHTFRLARRMMTAIRFNLSFSMMLNFAAIILAALGLLNPVTGALVHNAGSVAVVLHSALLLKWQVKNA